MASVEECKPYGGGPNLDVSELLLSCEQAGIVTGAGRFFSQEEQMQRDVRSHSDLTSLSLKLCKSVARSHSYLTTDLASKAVLTDPIDKLSLQ